MTPGRPESLLDALGAAVEVDVAPLGRTGGRTYDVAFDAAPGAGREAVDAAYLAKYAHSPYVAAMVTDEAAATTLQLVVAAGPGG
jgi:hypothetical protein